MYGGVSGIDDTKQQCCHCNLPHGGVSGGTTTTTGCTEGSPAPAIQANAHTEVSPVDVPVLQEWVIESHSAIDTTTENRKPGYYRQHHRSGFLNRGEHRSARAATPQRTAQHESGTCYVSVKKNDRGVADQREPLGPLRESSRTIQVRGSPMDVDHGGWSTIGTAATMMIGQECH
jgi:hypothetical protein